MTTRTCRMQQIAISTSHFIACYYLMLMLLQALEYDPAFQQAVRTSQSRRPPPTAARLATQAAGRRGLVVPPSSMGARPITGAQDLGSNTRPMTGVRAAGYTSGAARGM